jgi:hypothetical protein
MLEKKDTHNRTYALMTCSEKQIKASRTVRESGSRKRREENRTPVIAITLQST